MLILKERQGERNEWAVSLPEAWHRLSLSAPERWPAPSIKLSRPESERGTKRDYSAHNHFSLSHYKRYIVSLYSNLWAMGTDWHLRAKWGTILLDQDTFSRFGWFNQSLSMKWCHLRLWQLAQSSFVPWSPIDGRFLQTHTPRSMGW